MQLTEKHQEYWSKNLRITAILLFIWFVVTFVIGYYARELSLQLLRLAVRVLHGGAGLADHLRDHHLVLRALHEQPRPRVRRARRGGRMMAGPPQATGTGGVFSAGSQKCVQLAAEEGLHLVHGRLHRLRHRARDRRADGAAAAVDRLHLPARHDRPVRRHRRHEPDVGRRRVLRRRAARSRAVQRHGDRRRLDERRVVHRHGRHAVPHRASAASRSSWAGPAATCLVALFLAPYLRKFGQFTIPDFLGARYGGNIPRVVGIFAAILCSFTYVVAQIYGVGLITTRLTGVDVRARHLPGPRRHPGLLVPGRHARGDVDAGGAVHHPDHRLHDPGGLAVGEAAPASRCRSSSTARCSRR